MAMFTLIEINGDHLADLERMTPEVGDVLAAIVRNTSNAPRLLEEFDLYRVIRVVGQSAERHVYSDGKGVPKWNEIMRNTGFSHDGMLVEEEVVVEEGPTAQDADVGTPESDAALIRLQTQITHLNKTVEVQSRQIGTVSDRLEDLEDESNIDAASLKRTIDPLAERITTLEARVKLVAERITVLEAWRKS